MYFDNHKYNIITVWYIISQLTEDQSKFGMITQFDSSIKGYSIFRRAILGRYLAHTRKKAWQFYQVEEIWWRKIKHLKRLVYKVSSRFKTIDLLTLFHNFNYQLLSFPFGKQFLCIINFWKTSDPAIYHSFDKFLYIPQVASFQLPSVNLWIPEESSHLPFVCSKTMFIKLNHVKTKQSIVLSIQITSLKFKKFSCIRYGVHWYVSYFCILLSMIN